MKFTAYDEKNRIAAPAVYLALGLCTALGATVSVNLALVLGLLLLLVLLLSSVVVSAFRKILTEESTLPVTVIVVAAFVSVMTLLVQAFAPALYGALGVYLPLLAVNALILSRVQGFSLEHGIMESLGNSIFSGVSFLASLTVIALIREILGQGTITLFSAGSWNGIITVPVISSAPAKVLVSAAGGLIVLGMLLAFHSAVMDRRAKKENAA